MILLVIIFQFVFFIIAIVVLLNYWNSLLHKTLKNNKYFIDNLDNNIKEINNNIDIMRTNYNQIHNIKDKIPSDILSKLISNYNKLNSKVKKLDIKINNVQETTESSINVISKMLETLIENKS